MYIQNIPFLYTYLPVFISVHLFTAPFRAYPFTRFPCCLLSVSFSAYQYSLPFFFYLSVLASFFACLFTRFIFHFSAYMITRWLSAHLSFCLPASFSVLLLNRFFTVHLNLLPFYVYLFVRCLSIFLFTRFLLTCLRLWKGYSPWARRVNRAQPTHQLRT